jgi:hypothetical protein
MAAQSDNMYDNEQHVREFHGQGARDVRYRTFRGMSPEKQGRTWQKQWIGGRPGRDASFIAP